MKNVSVSFWRNHIIEIFSCDKGKGMNDYELTNRLQGGNNEIFRPRKDFKRPSRDKRFEENWHGNTSKMGVLNPETYSRKQKISSITGISNFNCHTQQHSNPLIISLLKKRKTRLFQLFQLFQLILKHIHPLSLIYIIYIIN